MTGAGGKFQTLNAVFYQLNNFYRKFFEKILMKWINRLLTNMSFNMMFNQESFQPKENEASLATFGLIDSQSAIRIATRFLEQHHSIIGTCAILEGKHWLITAKTGIMLHKVKTIMIDAKSGSLVQCV